MKIALGTIDLSPDECAAIAFYYGVDKISRESARHYIISNGRESIYDQMVAMEGVKERDKDE